MATLTSLLGSTYIGATGYTGSQGILGYTGSASTVIGYTGSLGYTGSQGAGYTGSASTVIGYTGSQGAGYTGSQGIIGYTGSAGYTGSQGVGFTGSAGNPTPAGSTTQIQYNNDGILAGATKVGISENMLLLTAGDPGTAPTAGTVRLFSRDVGGRILPAFVGPSGLDSSLQPLLARNKVAWFNPPGNATTVHVLGMAAPAAAGTATAASVATTNIHTSMKRLEYAVTTASTTAVAGARDTFAQYHVGSAGLYGGFTWIARFGPSRGTASKTTRRWFAGMTSNTAAPTDVNPSTTTTWANLIGVGADSTDTNFQIMHKLGTAAATKVDTGIPKDLGDATEMLELVLFTPPSSANITYTFTRLSTGASFSGTISTNMPAATTLLTWQIWSSVGGTSSVMGVAISSVYIETDY